MTRGAGFAVAFLLAMAALTPVAFARQTQTATLTVTVVDPSRLVVPGATVTVVGLDDATRKATIAAHKSSEKGVATFEGLAVGRYSVSGEFPGFEIGAIKELRLKAGDNKHVLVLPLAKMTAEITVGRDPQTAASDRASTFGSALTREQIDALSDDPSEMAQQLQDMAGAGATMRVDSFEGAQLPPKSQIKSIHVTRDAFAAENHAAGGLFVDIITQPGLGALRGTARLGLYNSVLDGQNPLVPEKGPAQTQTYSFNFGGPYIKDRGSFNVGVWGTHGYRTPNLYAATPSGTVAENVKNLRVPTDYFSMNANLDYALTKDQTLRLAFYRFTETTRNEGVGGYDLLARAYSASNSSITLRVQEAGPLGRRFFTNTRFFMNWTDSGTTSAVEAPTVTVNDAFTSGGAQRSGGRHTRTYSLQSDLDYVRGIHSVRLGISLNGGAYRSDDWLNYLGTYTFESLAAYEAGLPLTFTRRTGDPNISYSNWQAGFYVQDDIRVRKTLTLSPGVRVEAQTHVGDHNNIGPRFGVTWAPFKSGKTTLRASFGQFYDWLSADTYEQTLRVDGVRQQELIVDNPPYPVKPDSTGVIPPTNRYLLASDLELAQNTRFSAGIDQRITSVMRVGAIYADVRNHGLLVGHNLNAPADGVRPDPAQANVIESTSVGGRRARSLSTTTAFNFSPPSVGPATTGPRFKWRRGLSVNAGYTLSKIENNVDGPFIVPASGTLATEWGPGNADVRHRAYVSINSTALRNLTALVYVTVSTGGPYSIRTGHDDNGDLMWNDRPPGVARNTERAAGQWNSFGMFTYTIGLGKRTVPGGTGFVGSSSGGNISITPVAMGDLSRYRLSFSLNVQNLANHANYSGYSGMMTSPFFLKPTTVEGVRTMTLSIGFSF